MQTQRLSRLETTIGNKKSSVKQNFNNRFKLLAVGFLNRDMNKHRQPSLV
jgi:hypothetical protein